MNTFATYALRLPSAQQGPALNLRQWLSKPYMQQPHFLLAISSVTVFCLRECKSPQLIDLNAMAIQGCGKSWEFQATFPASTIKHMFFFDHSRHADGSADRASLKDTCEHLRSLYCV